VDKYLYFDGNLEQFPLQGKHYKNFFCRASCLRASSIPDGFVWTLYDVYYSVQGGPIPT
jgi:hypothetical protein